MSFTLKPYQEQSVQFALRNPYCILALNMGLGKSVVALDTFKRLGRGSKLLIVCPSYLMLNWKNEIKKFYVEQFSVSVFTKAKDIKVPDTDIAIVSYGLCQKGELLFKWADCVIADECFHGDTLIDTSEGKKKISDVEVGDFVWNCLGYSKVLRKIKTHPKEAVKLRFNGKEITCSLGHPYLTYRGWVKAGDLKKGDLLVTTTESLRLVRELPEPTTEKVLRKLLLDEIEKGFGEFPQGEIFPGGETEVVKKNDRENDNIREGEGGTQKKDEIGITANVKPGFKSKNGGYLKESRPQAEDSGWEWNRTIDRRGDTNPVCPILTMERSRENGDESWLGISDKLQIGPRGTGNKTGDRVRRGEPRLTIPETGGRQEREIAKFFRVESIEILQLGSSIGPTESCFYDLTVEGHPSFSVNGALVHNCHSLKEMKTQRTSFFHRAVYENAVKRLMLLTGTPIQNRVQEFYSLIALCNYNPQLKESKFLNTFPDSVSFADRYSFRREFDMKVGRRMFKVVRWEGIRRDDELKTWLQGIYIRFTSDKELGLDPIIYKDILVSDIEDKDLLNEFKKFQEENKSVAPDIKAKAALEKVPFTVKYVKALLEEIDSPIVIYSDHRESVRALAKEFEVAPITGETPMSVRQKLADAFQRGEMKVIVATIGSFSTGLTLTRSNQMVFNDFPWVPGQLAQSEYRINRIGQTRRCIIHRILGSHADASILKAIQMKSKVISRAL